MNEQAARDVVLVRAIETADSERTVFSNEDRAYASRAASELARWKAAERHSATSAELYIGQRAELLAGTLARRAPAIGRAARAFEWRNWIGVALPAVSLALGVLVEHIADRQHVNVLAFPLLAIVLWNVVVYALLLIRSVLRAGGVRNDVGSNLGGPRRWLAAFAHRSLPRASGSSADGIRVFVMQWSALVAPLMAARAARVLHLSAALFAIGAIAGLYVRGLVFEYRAGWESTFLDAPAVHGILSFFLAPAARWIGVAFPTVQEIAAMRFTGSAPGADASLWIHLYAVTVAAVVIVPRLALALIAWWQERRRAHGFTFDLNEPYFRRLVGSVAGGSAQLRVVPYSTTVDEGALQGLRTIATALLGDEAEVALQPSIDFGAEDSVNRALLGDQPYALTLALFSLAATPENENHGAFLKALRAATPARFAVLVDESGYRRRLGAQAGAQQRLAERRDAWRYFCQSLGMHAVFIDLNADLTAADLATAERELEPALAAPMP